MSFISNSNITLHQTMIPPRSQDPMIKNVNDTNNKLLIVTDDQIINETNVYNENISAINVFTLAL